LVRQAAHSADLLIAPSRFLIQQYTEAGFAAGRFLYLENGIDVERIQRYPRRPSPDGKLRFTYLGSLAWQKGVHVLVEAFKGIPPDAAVLKIYGDPTVFPDYSGQLREIADPLNTHFEGPVPNEQVGRVLAETDVLVVPSLWYENSPVVIQEAFAAGVPVIASEIGALPEKVSSEDRLFEPGDAAKLRRLAQDIIAREDRLSRFGAATCPRSMSEAVNDLLNTYAPLERRGGRRPIHST
jgi:glycosyltransferase involved in cell wall biosynthesis